MDSGNYVVLPSPIGQEVRTSVVTTTKNASLKFRIRCRVAPLVRQPIEHRSGRSRPCNIAMDLP